MCPGLRLEVWLGRFAHLLGAVKCRGHALLLRILFLFPALQKWQLGFFGLFVSYCH